MKTTSIAVAALAMASAALASPAPLKKRSITPVTVSGNAFWQGSERFFIKGVDYQPGGSSTPIDPIANAATCQRDIAYFKQLGVNTVRVYTVDNTANHDECMSALADAGIYLALDVNTPKYSLNRAEPAPSYNNVYLKNIFATIDMFSQYDNTLLFFSGNEVINDATNTNCAPYVKAVTRDMRQYIRARGYRTIPVGYSAADVAENRYQMAAYMNCGDEAARSDFFAFNDYSWCYPSSYQQSGWADEVQLYSNYSIPLFLSEFGCIKNPPRRFQEIAALYSDAMAAVYSGGMTYQYSEESDNPGYGLVTINSATSVSPLPDFANLQSELKANPPPTGAAGAKTSGTPAECPAQSSEWDVSTDALPAMPVPAVAYLKSGAGKGYGLSGSGSQDAGVASSGTAVAGSASFTANPNSVANEAGSSSSSAAASSSFGMGPIELGPLACGLVVVVSTFLGAALL